MILPDVESETSDGNRGDEAVIIEYIELLYKTNHLAAAVHEID